MIDDGCFLLALFPELYHVTVNRYSSISSYYWHSTMHHVSFHFVVPPLFSVHALWIELWTDDRRVPRILL